MSVVVNHGEFAIRSKMSSSPSRLGPGSLVLVVGPSGSGKDTLLRGAAEQLADNPRFVFPKRAITRPSDPNSEVHDTLSMLAFSAIEAAGEAAFSWQAHGHGYVIPKSVEADIQAGKTVIFNASRSMIEDAQQRYSSVGVLHISVPDHVLRTRIENRGRETDGDVTQRLSRAKMTWQSTGHIFEIENDGSVEDGVAKMVAAIHDITAN